MGVNGINARGENFQKRKQATAERDATAQRAFGKRHKSEAVIPAAFVLSITSLSDISTLYFRLNRGIYDN